MSQLLEQARKVELLVKRLADLVRTLEGDAARLVFAAEQDHQLHVQVAAGHLLSHVLRLDETWRREIAAETLAAGRYLLEGLDPETRATLEAVREAIAFHSEGT